MPRSIAVIDDHQLFSSGLAQLLAPLGEVRTFADPGAAVAALRDRPADLVLLDFYLPGSNAAETIAALKEAFEATRVVVLTASLSPADRAASLAAGAAAYLTKHTDPAALLEACGEILSGAAASEAARPEAAQQAAAAALGLTARQVDVLVMLGHGYSNREIAELLSVAPETVKSHLKAIFDRLEVSSRTEAVTAAREQGLL